jgi:hypothetical protein
VRMLSILFLEMVSDGRCGLNLWIRKLEIDGKHMEQTMYSDLVRCRLTVEIWGARILRQ